MARQNRRDIFDPNEVGAYHAVQRTVRRAWLCAMDTVSGKSFEHTWIQDRLQELSASFGIACLSFAVMVNHVHVILRNRPDVVVGWSDEEVARRWWQLFPLRRNKDKTAAIEPADRRCLSKVGPQAFLFELISLLIEVDYGPSLSDSSH